MLHLYVKLEGTNACIIVGHVTPPTPRKLLVRLVDIMVDIMVDIQLIN